MNDLYTFDCNLKEAENTFNLINESYNEIFKLLQLQVIPVEADNGVMGGLKSIEYHVITSSGEDTILICSNCKYSMNKEICKNPDTCPRCSAGLSFKEFNALELGHCFLLGTRYTQIFNVDFINQQQEKNNAVMGCFGIGISRLLGALGKVHSDDDGLKWPDHISPFKLNVIPKFPLTDELVHYFSNNYGNEHVLIDDEEGSSIGKRLHDSFLLGIPKTIIIGNSWKERHLLEEYDRLDQKCNFINPLQTLKLI